MRKLTKKDLSAAGTTDADKDSTYAIEKFTLDTSRTWGEVSCESCGTDALVEVPASVEVASPGDPPSVKWACDNCGTVGAFAAPEAVAPGGDRTVAAGDTGSATERR